jgi:hypothetical protein
MCAWIEERRYHALAQASIPRVCSWLAVLTLGAAVCAIAQADIAPVPPPQDLRARLGEVLYSDDFREGLGNWAVEAERPAQITARDGVLEIDTPAGLTLWFKQELRGPVLIEYQAQAVAAGGPNDRVSDLNCFWMATDPRAPGSLLSRPRSGVFTDYNGLLTYYVGLGGNGNTTTRFRRYIGSESERPLRPEDDRSAPSELLQPNRIQTIRLVADGGLIQYYRDEQRVFEFRDPKPYTHGWFAIRTTKSHLRIRHFRVYSLGK